MESLLTADAFLALVTLTAMEIVLGIDNLVFILILTGKLPPGRQPIARKVGLAAAVVTRVALLFAITWVIGLTVPLFHVLGQPVSGRDLILLLGGLFLIAKATWEIYDKVEAAHDEPTVFIESSDVNAARPMEKPNTSLSSTRIPSRPDAMPNPPA